MSDFEEFADDCADALKYTVGGWGKSDLPEARQVFTTAKRHARLLEAIKKWVDSPTKYLGSNQGDFERGTREGQKRAKDYVRQLLEQP